MAGTLYLVATPLGNLGDMTFRAVETLKKVSAVVAEDTRRAGILCSHFAIATALTSMPAFAERDRADALVARLLAGDDLALVTDAGSPGISDPGTLLVQRAIAAGITVVPIPGASAVVAALSASGLATDRFHFVGFVARKGEGRREELSRLARLPGTLVLYESPNRLHETLLELAQLFGDRPAVVARELTKLHEEFARGTLSELAARYAGEVKGEVTLLVEGAPRDTAEKVSDGAILSEVKRRLDAGETSVKEISRELSEATGRPRKEIYALALTLAGKP